MSMMDKLRADQLAARKAKDSLATGLLTALVGEATRVGKDAGNRETTDEEALRVVKKFLDNARETAGLVDGEARSKANAEIAILEGYMPTQMSEAEIEAVFVDLRAVNADLNLGVAMAHLKTTFPGRYDGKLASQVARRVLA